MNCHECGRLIDGKNVFLAFGTDVCRLCDLLLTAAEPGHAHPAGWPMQSVALACHKSQVAEMTERNRRHGITGVSYHADGTCQIDSPGEYKKLMKIERVHHNNNPRGPGV